MENPEDAVTSNEHSADKATFGLCMTDDCFREKGIGSTAILTVQQTVVFGERHIIPNIFIWWTENCPHKSSDVAR